MGNIEKFEAMAGRYDTAERIAVAQAIARAIREQVHHAHEKEAIDYGCGTGLVGLELTDLFRSVLFIDASPGMVEQVRRKIEAADTPGARAMCADFMAEPPPNVRADYIIVAQVLLHIPDIEPFLSRLRMALRPGGHLLIVDFDKNEAVESVLVHNGFEQPALVETLMKLGFTEAESKTFYHGEGIFMKKDASLFLLDAVKNGAP